MSVSLRASFAALVLLISSVAAASDSDVFRNDGCTSVGISIFSSLLVVAFIMALFTLNRMSNNSSEKAQAQGEIAKLKADLQAAYRRMHDAQDKAKQVHVDPKLEKDAKTARSTADRLQQEVTKLKSESADLRSSLAKRDEQLEIRRKALAQLEAKLGELRGADKDLKSVQGSLEKAEAKVKQLESDLASSSLVELEQVKGKLLKAEAANKKLAALEAVAAEVGELKTELARLKASEAAAAKEASKSAAAAKKATDELKKAQAAADAAESEIKKCKEAAKTASAEAAAATKAKSVAEMDATSLREQLAHVNQKILDAHSECTELQEQVAAARREGVQQVEIMQQKLDQAKDDVNAARAEMAQYKQRASDAESQAQKSQSGCTAAEAKVKAANDKIKEMTTQAKTAEERTRKAEAGEKEARSLAQAANARAEAAEANAAAGGGGGGADHSEELKSLRSDVDKHQEIERQLKREVEELGGKARAAEARATASDAKAKASDAKASAAEAKASATQALEASVGRYEKQVRDLTARVKELESEAGQSAGGPSQSDLDKVKQENESLRRQLRDAVQREASWGADKTSLTQQLARTETEIADLRKQLHARESNGSGSTHSTPTQRPQAGIGLELLDSDGAIVIKNVRPNTPASQSEKFRNGDEIIAIDNRSVVGMQVSGITHLIIGDRGSQVVLTVRRGREQFSVRLQRQLASVAK